MMASQVASREVFTANGSAGGRAFQVAVPFLERVTSQIFSATYLMPTFSPANTKLRLILRRPIQIRPQVVTVTVRSCMLEIHRRHRPTVSCYSYRFFRWSDC